MLLFSFSVFLIKHNTDYITNIQMGLNVRLFGVYICFTAYYKY